MEGRSPLRGELLSIHTAVIHAGNQGLGLRQLGASGGQLECGGGELPAVADEFGNRDRCQPLFERFVFETFRI